MQVGYVVLYVNDADACVEFWTTRFGMVIKSSNQAGKTVVSRVGFLDQDFTFELVPLALMQENPDGLDLATPSICFFTEELDAERQRLVSQGVQVTEITKHNGVNNFAFCDNEGRWFAVTQKG